MAKASLWTTVSFAIGKVAQLMAQVILARLLSPEDFGIWAMVLVLSNFSLLFRDTTIAQVLVQRGLDDIKLVNTVYSMGVNISIFLFGIQLLAGLPLSYFFNKPILFPLTALSAVVFLIGAGAGSHTAVLQRKMKIKELAMCDLLANFSRVLTLVISSISGWGFWSFAIGEIVMAVVDSLLKRYLSKHKFKYYFKLEKSKINEVKEFIFGVLGSRIALQLNITGDNFIIGKFLGTQALGYYSVAYQLATTPAVAFSQINNRVIFSTISQVDEQRKLTMIQRLIEYYASTAALIYGLAFTLAPSIIPFIYGDNWQQSITIFQIILVYAYTGGLMSILGAYLLSINKSLEIARIDWFIVPFSLTAYFIGVKTGGIQGVAIAVMCVMGFAALIWYVIAASRVSGAGIKDFLKPAFIPSFSMFIALVLSQFTPYLQNADFYLKAITIIVTYISMLVLLSKGNLPFSLMKFIFYKS
ncbi:oligosaccharide flippase family protein [Calothrix sp. PCC 7507]|uniref:oligosaccharide flippase family protein n=1 Tax=Calothrix sp. PCC 7507 TaxID=99598 RepID=UPI0002E2D69D|nr:oligosaccharide flippase family protein [Calothrix sp. PCC 7507]